MEPWDRGGKRETPQATSGHVPRAPTMVASGAMKAKEKTKPPVEWDRFLRQTLKTEGRLPSAFPIDSVGLLPPGCGLACLPQSSVLSPSFATLPANPQAHVNYLTTL